MSQRVGTIDQLLAVQAVSLLCAASLIFFVYHLLMTRALQNWEDTTTAWNLEMEKQRLSNSAASQKIILEVHFQKLYEDVYILKTLGNKFRMTPNSYLPNPQSKRLVCSYYELESGLCDAQVYEVKQSNNLHVDLFFERNRRSVNTLLQPQLDFLNTYLHYSFLMNAIIAADTYQLFNIIQIYDSDDTSFLAGGPAIYDSFSYGDYLTCMGPGYPEPWDPRCRDWYQYASENPGYHFYSPYIDGATGSVLMTISSSTKDSAGHTLSVLSIDFGIQNIFSSVYDKFISQTEYPVLFHQSDHQVLYHRWFNNSLGEIKTWSEVEFNTTSLQEEKSIFESQLNATLDFLSTGHYHSLEENSSNLDSLFQVWTRDKISYLSIVYPIEVDTRLSEQKEGMPPQNKYSPSIILTAKVQLDNSKLIVQDLSDLRTTLTEISIAIEATLVVILIVGSLFTYNTLLHNTFEIPLDKLTKFLKLILHSQIISDKQDIIQSKRKSLENSSQPQLHSHTSHRKLLPSSFQQGTIRTVHYVNNKLPNNHMRKSNHLLIPPLQTQPPISQEESRLNSVQQLESTKRKQRLLNPSQQQQQQQQQQQNLEKSISTSKIKESLFFKQRYPTNEIRQEQLDGSLNLEMSRAFLNNKTNSNMLNNLNTNNNSLLHQNHQSSQQNSFTTFQNRNYSPSDNLKAFHAFIQESKANAKQIQSQPIQSQDLNQLQHPPPQNVLNQQQQQLDSIKINVYDNSENQILMGENHRFNSFSTVRTKQDTINSKKRGRVSSISSMNNYEPRVSLEDITPMFKEMEIIKETFNQLEKVINYTIFSRNQSTKTTESIMHFAQAKGLFKVLKNPNGQLRASLSLGALHIINNEYTLASEHFHSAMQTFLEHHGFESLNQFNSHLQSGSFFMHEDSLLLFAKTLFAKAFISKIQSKQASKITEETTSKSFLCIPSQTLLKQGMESLNIILRIMRLNPQLFSFQFRMILTLELIEFHLFSNDLQACKAFLTTFQTLKNLYFLCNRDDEDFQQSFPFRNHNNNNNNNNNNSINKSKKEININSNQQQNPYKKTSSNLKTKKSAQWILESYRVVIDPNHPDEMIDLQLMDLLNSKWLLLSGKVYRGLDESTNAMIKFASCIEEGSYFDPIIRHDAEQNAKEHLEAKLNINLTQYFPQSTQSNHKNTRSGCDFLILLEEDESSRLSLPSISFLRHLIEISFFSSNDLISIVTYGSEYPQIVIPPLSAFTPQTVSGSIPTSSTFPPLQGFTWFNALLEAKGIQDRAHSMGFLPQQQQTTFTKTLVNLPSSYVFDSGNTALAAQSSCKIRSVSKLNHSFKEQLHSAMIAGLLQFKKKYAESPSSAQTDFNNYNFKRRTQVISLVSKEGQLKDVYESSLKLAETQKAYLVERLLLNRLEIYHLNLLNPNYSDEDANLQDCSEIQSISHPSSLINSYAFSTQSQLVENLLKDKSPPKQEHSIFLSFILSFD